MQKKYVRAGVGIMLLIENKVLLGKRHDDPEKASSELHGEGTWTFPGGKADFGLTLVENVNKELMEETGIKVNSLKLLSITDEIVPDAHFTTIGFLCTDFEGEARVLEPDEITQWKWFDLSELPLNIYPASKKMIDNYNDNVIYRI